MTKANLVTRTLKIQFDPEEIVRLEITMISFLGAK